jgi:hypothetical protein
MLNKGSPGIADQEYMPSLRGGGGESRNENPIFGDREALPGALWYLAGGRGKPITVECWRRQKPKRRIDRLLGMAIYGEKAG